MGAVKVLQKPQEESMSANDRIRAFVYLLVRDEVPFGVVERIMGEIETADRLGGALVFSDESQAEYALTIAARLEDGVAE